MQMTDTFSVDVPAQRLWDALIDVERIAPCVPGFKLIETNDPDFGGEIKVKVGAITVGYDATITFKERDEAARRVVLGVKGKERRGAGSVDATTTLTLSGNGSGTTAEILTDVQITGKVAQFGRGIIADVNRRLLEQFVACLNERVLAPPQAAEAPGAAPTPQQPARSDEPLEALDIGAVAGGAILKRAAPAAALLVLLLTIAAIARRRSR